MIPWAHRWTRKQIDAPDLRPDPKAASVRGGAFQISEDRLREFLEAEVPTADRRKGWVGGAHPHLRVPVHG